MPDNNKWSEMKSAEWRGRLGATVEGIERDLAKLGANVTALCAKVDVHETALAVVQDRMNNTQLGARARAAITAALILAAASIAVAIIGLLGG
jgi:hypothetical protein